MGEFAVLNSISSLFNIAILAIFSTVIGLFGFMKSISLLDVGLVSVISLFETMFTVVLSYLAMETTLTMLQIFGGLIVLARVYVYEKRIFNGKKITITVRANRP